MIAELVGELGTPLRGLAVALAGALLAYLWYDNHRGWAIAIGVAASLLGYLLDGIGRGLLPNKPVAGLWFLEFWVLTPAALAAIAGAVVVLVTVALAVPDGTAASTKETIGALSTGLTSFITAAFISWAGDEKDSKVADHIRDVFSSKFDRADGDRKPGVHYFRTESPGEMWVYSDEFRGIEGWGHHARLRRARGIAAELRSRTSEPVGTA